MQLLPLCIDGMMMNVEIRDLFLGCLQAHYFAAYLPFVLHILKSGDLLPSGRKTYSQAKRQEASLGLNGKEL